MIGIGFTGLLELIGGIFRKIFRLKASAEERRRSDVEDQLQARRLGIVVVVTVVAGGAVLVGVMRFSDGFY
jgi:hypothetical protein